MRRRSQTPRLEFESWAANRYDFVWFERATTFEAMGRPVSVRPSSIWSIWKMRRHD